MKNKYGHKIKVWFRIRSLFMFLDSAWRDIVVGFNGESKWSLLVEDWQDMKTRNHLTEDPEMEEIAKKL
jgi:hypothetical protein